MKYSFEENQQFREWWIWVILFVILISSTVTTAFNMIAFLVISPVILLMYFSKLRIKINKEGVYYQFFPFHFKSYQINFDEIKTAQAITYSPIKDYGGWGIRYGFKGTAYNVSGNKGVQLELKSGKRILFGSQRSEELEFILKEFMRS